MHFDLPKTKIEIASAIAVERHNIEISQKKIKVIQAACEHWDRIVHPGYGRESNWTECKNCGASL